MPEPIDVVEALLFASDTPVEAERIQEVLDLESAAAAREIVEGLRARLDAEGRALQVMEVGDRKSTRLNSSHQIISYAVFCLKKKKSIRQGRCCIYTPGDNHICAGW